MKKGEIFEGTIERIEFPNKGIVQIDGKPVIVKNGIPGARVRFRINKKKGDRVEGCLQERLEKSPLETREALCECFPDCGGCVYQTMSYRSQLEMKQRQIRTLIERALVLGKQTDSAGQPDYIFEGILPSPLEAHYRNKMEYSFGDSFKGGPLSLGLHKKNSTYDVLTADTCQIVHEDFNRILSCVLTYCTEQKLPYYHKMSHVGFLRHLLVRRAEATGEILAALVTSSQMEVNLTPLTERLKELHLEGRLTGFLHIINDSPADVVKSDKTSILYGRDYFYEEILGLKFRITPFSFFQTNSRGAEVLYGKAREYIGDVKDAVVFDLYSGTGTIGQIMAPAAKKVIGVEIVEEAVVAARENALGNHLENCTFLAGDVLKMLDEIKERPDYIILDPPRDGIHPKALRKIIDYGVDRLVYISCKPTSLIRDLDMFLMNGYRVEKVSCVDMFPWTYHVEPVVLLSKAN